MDPENKKIQTRLGIAHTKLNHYDLALELLSKALEDKKNPLRILASSFRGLVYHYTGKHQLSLKDNLETKRLMDKNVDVEFGPNERFLLALSISENYSALNEYEKGLDYLNEGLELLEADSSHMERTLRQRAHLYQLLGRFSRALEDLQSLLKMKPDNADLLKEIETLQGLIKQANQPKEQKPENAPPAKSKEGSDTKILNQLKAEMQVAKEREQKRQIERLQKEEQKKQFETEEILKQELQKEFERKLKKYSTKLPAASATNKVSKKVAKQDFSEGMDWWKNPDKVDEYYQNIPLSAPAAIPKQQTLQFIAGKPFKNEDEPKAQSSDAIDAFAVYKPAPYVYRPLPSLTGQPISHSQTDRSKLITAERMIMHGLEDLYTRTYGEKPYYDLANETHRTLVKHGFLYYALRMLEALHPTGRLLTKQEEEYVSIVNNFVAEAEKIRELRHQVRNCPHLITLKSLVNFARAVKQGGLLGNIKYLLESQTYPQEPKPMKLSHLELCSLKEKMDWDTLDTKVKKIHLLQMIVQQLKQMKSYVKPLGNNKNQFYIEGELQNVVKMSIAIIGKNLSILTRECGFKHVLLNTDIFRAMVKYGIEISHAIGEDIEFYEFDEISPALMFDIAFKADVHAQQVESLFLKGT